jgi:hypothetical protein
MQTIQPASAGCPLSKLAGCANQIEPSDGAILVKGPPAGALKFYLRVDQISRLLCVGGPCNLKPFEQFSQWRTHMTNETLTVRIAQALLAVGVTTVTVLVFQVAMVAG